MVAVVKEAELALAMIVLLNLRVLSVVTCPRQYPGFSLNFSEHTSERSVWSAIEEFEC